MEVLKFIADFGKKKFKSDSPVDCRHDNRALFGLLHLNTQDDSDSVPGSIQFYCFSDSLGLQHFEGLLVVYRALFNGHFLCCCAHDLLSSYFAFHLDQFD